MPLAVFPIILFGIPLAEIAGFVMVGKAIGLWPTLGLVILTSLVGAILLRIEGTSVLREASRESREGRLPGKSLVSGAMVVMAGILLILPGFFTDIIGLLLFIPPVRHLLWSVIGRRVVVVRSSQTRPRRPENGPNNGGGQRPGEPGVLDLDEKDYSRGPNPSSPWSDGDNRRL